MMIGEERRIEREMRIEERRRRMKLCLFFANICLLPSLVTAAAAISATHATHALDKAVTEGKLVFCTLYTLQPLHGLLTVRSKDCVLQSKTSTSTVCTLYTVKHVN